MELDAIRKVWCDSLVIPVLQTVMEQLALRHNGRFCSDRVVQLSLNFLVPAVEMGSTYKCIKPHMDFLLFNVGMKCPRLCEIVPLQSGTSVHRLVFADSTRISTS